MVFFSCGECGESMKKNQVEKHCSTKCRNCPFVSCVDCGKEFWGYDYQIHIKCISEEEKTHGALYKKHPNANKGERKQEMWVQQVHGAISKVKSNPSLSKLLEKLKDYPNIPRKKAKFENFVKNSLRVNDCQLLGKAWDALSQEIEVEVQTKNLNRDVCGVDDSSKDRAKLSNGNENGQNKLNKKRKTDKGVENDSKKRKCVEPEDGIEMSKEPKYSKESQQKEIVVDGKCPDKKKHDLSVECQPDSEDHKNENSDSISHRFKWKSTIVATLKEASEHKMTIKKLKKKVLAKMKQSTDLTVEEMKIKFDDKLSKCSHVKIVNDIVTMCS